jgi:hypothetical protein
MKPPPPAAYGADGCNTRTPSGCKSGDIINGLKKIRIITIPKKKKKKNVIMFSNAADEGSTKGPQKVLKGSSDKFQIYICVESIINPK